MIPSPLVFDGTAYTRKLHPIDCSVYLSLSPLSTANITVPATDEIAPLDWVQIFTPDGQSGYYRVASVSTNAVNGDKSVYLEHGACTLGDVTIPEIAVDATTTSSSSHGANLKEYPENKTDTITNLLTYVLGRQGTGGKWTVGIVEATETIYMEFGNYTILDCISSMMAYIPDYQLEFVQNDENDWRVDIKARPTTPLCEARMARNMRNVDISYNTSSICTRVYCEGLTGGHMDSQNIALYGVRSENQSLSDNLSLAQKEAIVASYLANHDHPAISITISGVELSQLTGLDIDKFTVGQVCRVALPHMGITANEVIIDKRYADVYGSPEEVSITLANATPDLVIAMASVTSSAGGGIAGKQIQAEKEKKRYETHFEQTDEYFRLIATDTEWDEMGHGEVTAYGQIVLTSASFQAVVSQIGQDGTITAASIALAINEAGSNAYINADHIYLNATSGITLGGFVQVTGTTFQIEEGVGGDGTLSVETVECGFMECNIASADRVTAANYISADTMYIDDPLSEHEVRWQSKTVCTGVNFTAPTLYRSDPKEFVYIENGQEATWLGRVVTGWDAGSITPITTTIYYLGRT